MRDGQARLVEVQVVVQEEVEVDRPRPPALRANTPEALLDPEQALEQVPRGEVCLDPDGAVQERALLHRPHGLGLTDLGDAGDVDPVLGGQQLDGAAQILLTVAEIGADTDESSLRHRCYLRPLEASRGHYRARSTRVRAAVDGARGEHACARALRVPRRARSREARGRPGAPGSRRREDRVRAADLARADALGAPGAPEADAIRPRLRSHAGPDALDARGAT